MVGLRVINVCNRKSQSWKMISTLIMSIRNNTKAITILISTSLWSSLNCNNWKTASSLLLKTCNYLDYLEMASEPSTSDNNASMYSEPPPAYSYKANESGLLFKNVFTCALKALFWVHLVYYSTVLSYSYYFIICISSLIIIPHYPSLSVGCTSGIISVESTMSL